MTNYEEKDMFEGLRAVEPSPECDRKIAASVRAKTVSPDAARENRQIVITLAAMATLAAAVVLFLLFSPTDNTDSRPAQPAKTSYHFAADDDPIGDEEQDSFKEYGTTTRHITKLLKEKYQEANDKEMTEEELEKALEETLKGFEKATKDAVEGDKNKKDQGLVERRLPGGAAVIRFVRAPGGAFVREGGPTIINIHIDAKGNIRVGGEATDLDEVAEAMQELIDEEEEDAEIQVVIRGSLDTPFDTVTKIMEALKDEEIFVTSIEMTSNKTHKKK